MKKLDALPENESWNKLKKVAIWDVIDISSESNGKFVAYIDKLTEVALSDSTYDTTTDFLLYPDFEGYLDMRMDYSELDIDKTTKYINDVLKKRVLMNDLSYAFITKIVQQKINDSIWVISSDDFKTVTKKNKIFHKYISESYLSIINIIRVLSVSYFWYKPIKESEYLRISYELWKIPDIKKILWEDLISDVVSIINLVIFNKNDITSVNTSHWKKDVDNFSLYYDGLNASQKLTITSDIVKSNSGIIFILLSLSFNDKINKIWDKLPVCLNEIESDIIKVKYGVSSSRKISKVFLNSPIEGDIFHFIEAKRIIIWQIILENPSLFFGNNELVKNELYLYLISDIDVKYDSLKNILSLKANKNLWVDKLVSILKWELDEGVITNVEVTKVSVTEVLVSEGDIDTTILKSIDSTKIIEEDNKEKLLELFWKSNCNTLLKKSNGNGKNIKILLKIWEILPEEDKNDFLKIYYEGNNLKYKTLNNIYRALVILKKYDSHCGVIKRLWRLRLDEKSGAIWYLFKLTKNSINIDSSMFRCIILDFLDNLNYKELDLAFGLVDHIKEDKELDSFHKILSTFTWNLTKKDVIDKLLELWFDVPVWWGNHLVMTHPIYHFKIPLPWHNMNRALGKRMIGKLKHDLIKHYNKQWIYLQKT